MKTPWLTADLHIGHKNIITYCDRPWKSADGQPLLREMNHALVDNINERVKKDDWLIIDGDFCWGPAAYQKGWFDLINGQKSLVLGNHDNLSRGTYRYLGFKDVESHIRLGRIRIQHHPPLPARAVELMQDGIEVVLCGHVHERWSERDVAGLRVVNVGVDVRGFRPVKLEELNVDPALLWMVNRG